MIWQCPPGNIFWGENGPVECQAVLYENVEQIENSIIYYVINWSSMNPELTIMSYH